MIYTTEKYDLEKATPGSAGYDLRFLGKHSEVIGAREILMINTGIRIASELPAFVYGRSSWGAKYGITLANAVGVIDSDYRGEIKVALINNGPHLVEIKPGDRIAQLVPSVGEPEPVKVKQLASTKRGVGGFGSTGVN